MLDIGWTELLIIGVVALIVVGPKDLPKMFRTLGQVTGKARAMAREFQSAMESAADEAGVKDMARELRDATSGRKLREASGLNDLERDLRDIERDMSDVERDMSIDEKGVGKGGVAGKRVGDLPAGTKPGVAASPGGSGDDGMEFDEEGADALIAAEHDAAIAAAQPSAGQPASPRPAPVQPAGPGRKTAAKPRAAPGRSAATPEAKAVGEGAARAAGGTDEGEGKTGAANPRAGNATRRKTAERAADRTGGKSAGKTAPKTGGGTRKKTAAGAAGSSAGRRAPNRADDPGADDGPAGGG